MMVDMTGMMRQQMRIQYLHRVAADIQNRHALANELEREAASLPKYRGSVAAAQRLRRQARALREVAKKLEKITV